MSFLSFCENISGRVDCSEVSLKSLAGTEISERPESTGRPSRALLVLVLLLCCFTTTGCKRNTGGKTSRLPEVIRESDRNRSSAKVLYHTIVRGESLWKLHDIYDVDVSVLRRVNHFKNNEILNIGQEVLIPGDPKVLLSRKMKYLKDHRIKTSQVGSSRTTSANTKKPSKSRNTGSSNNKNTAGNQNNKRRVKTPTNVNNTVTGPTRNTSTTATGTTSNNGKKLNSAVKPFFIKPMKNCRIETHFGKGQGVFTNGATLFSPDNEQVMAAASGTVEYSGNVDKLGEVVILSHQMNFFSLYANVSRPLVVPGETVQAGEPVAVGAAGNSSLGEKGYKMYFEIRSGDTPVDPELLMK